MGKLNKKALQITIYEFSKNLITFHLRKYKKIKSWFKKEKKTIKIEIKKGGKS